MLSDVNITIDPIDSKLLPGLQYLCFNHDNIQGRIIQNYLAF